MLKSVFIITIVAVAMIGMIVPSFANHSEVTIVTVDESGFSQACVNSGCYTPFTAIVDIGGVVTMTNTDPTGIHTFTSGTIDGFAPSPDLVFDSSVLRSGNSFEWIPTQAGEQPYYCMLHTWMIGTIIVQEVHADDNAEAEEAAAAEAAAAEAAAAEAAAAEAAAAEAAALVAEEAAADVELMVMISDSQVMGGTQIELEFSELHVNYDLTATQNGEVVFEETGLHSMEVIATHQIDAVGSDENPIDVQVVSLGIGAPGNEDNWTGPVGQVTTAQVVPEFGTIAMMVLAVAIISIVAVTAKSRVVPRF